MMQPESRRPLASRNAGWARALARRLAATSITPNQVSMASMVFAALAGLALFGSGQSGGVLRAALLVLAAAACQLRLVCNLMDGLLAIEAGKQTKDGPFWNEFPDRVSDIFILVGLGYGTGLVDLGWAAAAFAVLTAYTRELGRAVGLPADFAGPMAKPQRMAVVTVAALVSVLEPIWAGQGGVLALALWVICLGAVATTLRRAWRMIEGLKARS